MQRLLAGHAPEFAGLGITMPQAKILYVVTAAGRLRMSELAARLGVTSSVSGLVERLVEPAARPGRRPRRPAPGRRHPDSGGRRPPRTLPRPQPRQMRSCSCSMSDDDLDAVERAVTDRPGRPSVTRPASHSPRPKGNPREPAHRVRPPQAKRHAALRGRRVHRRCLRPGAASSRNSSRTSSSRSSRSSRRTRSRCRRRDRAGDQAHRARHPGVPRLTNLQSTSSNSISLVVAQFSYGTDVKATRAAIAGRDTTATAGERDPEGPGPEHQPSPVIIASIAATGRRPAGRRHRPDRDRPGDPGPSRASRAPT